MIKVYASPNCPHCRQFRLNMDANKLNYEYIDIDASMANLKAFLKLRDTRPEYEEVREKHMVGVPTIITEDGTLTLDWRDYLKSKGIDNLITEADMAHTSCNLDGTGC